MIRDLFPDLVNAVREYLAPPPRPGAILFNLNAKVTAMKIQVNLTAPKAPDVVSRELTYTINGGAPVVVTVAPADPPHTFLADIGAVIVGSLVDINAKGFRSPASDAATLTVVDVSPPKPDAPVFEEVPG